MDLGYLLITWILYVVVDRVFLQDKKEEKGGE
jgi:hypothetical protein